MSKSSSLSKLQRECQTAYIKNLSAKDFLSNYGYCLIGSIIASYLVFSPCRTVSYKTIAAAVATLRDSADPRIGIFSKWSQSAFA